jgi:hypothetical protein
MGRRSILNAAIYEVLGMQFLYGLRAVGAFVWQFGEQFADGPMEDGMKYVGGYFREWGEDEAPVRKFRMGHDERWRLVDQTTH